MFDDPRPDWWPDDFDERCERVAGSPVGPPPQADASFLLWLARVLGLVIDAAALNLFNINRAGPYHQEQYGPEFDPEYYTHGWEFPEAIQSKVDELVEALTVAAQRVQQPRLHRALIASGKRLESLPSDLLTLRDHLQRGGASVHEEEQIRDSARRVELAAGAIPRDDEDTLRDAGEPTAQPPTDAGAQPSDSREAASAPTAMADAPSNEWKPPPTHIGAKAIEHERDVPRSTFQGWEQTDRRKDKLKAADVVCDPESGEKYYPQSWLDGRMRCYKPRRRTT